MSLVEAIVFPGIEDFTFTGKAARQNLHLMLRAWFDLPHFKQTLVGAFFAMFIILFLNGLE
jgi:hypothetical protein